MSDPPREEDLRQARPALVAFVAWAVISVVAVVLELGDHQWFLVDDWRFFAERSATDPGDLFGAHNQHWSAVPVLIYRVMFRIFGLSYLPYQVLVLLSHVMVAGLLRVVMRRSGVGPWLATVAAGSLLLLGPGHENIVWSFQIGFNAALCFGLLQVLLAGHDGDGIDRRDGLALVAGLLALMSAGIGPPMVAAAGFAAWCRRGPRAALLQVVPLGTLYLVWYLVQDVASETSAVGRPSPGQVVRWLVSGETGAFLAMGQHTVVGLLLAVVLVVGLVLAWGGTDRPTLRVRAALPAALLLGSVLVQLGSSVNRFWLGEEGARGSRYLYVIVALTLPALAVAVGAVARRWRVLTPLGYALFLLPIPWQVRDFEPAPPFDQAYFEGRRAALVDLATAPAVDLVPAWVQPAPEVWGFGPVTAGWLIEQREHGRLPERPDGVPPADPGLLELQFGVAQTWWDGPGAAPPSGLEQLRLLFESEAPPVPEGVTCTEHTTPVLVEPSVGDEVILGSPVWVSSSDGSQRVSAPRPIDPIYGQVLSFQLPDLRLQFEAPAGATSMTLCERDV